MVWIVYKAVPVAEKSEVLVRPLGNWSISFTSLQCCWKTASELVPGNEWNISVLPHIACNTVVAEQLASVTAFIVAVSEWSREAQAPVAFVGRVSTTPSLAGKSLLENLPSVGHDPDPKRGAWPSPGQVALPFPPQPALAKQQCSPNLNSCFSVD